MADSVIDYNKLVKYLRLFQKYIGSLNGVETPNQMAERLITIIPLTRRRAVEIVYDIHQIFGADVFNELVTRIDAGQITVAPVMLDLITKLRI